ncbi:MAG: hypothetical protein PWQ35_513 [Patescibacteria group bacterium]|nr:hypothetical protein [Patescibacteria group bacterium]
MKILRKKYYLDFFFPKFCLNCQRVNNSYLCFSCFKKINYNGAIIKSPLLNVTESIVIGSSDDPILNQLIKAYYFKGIKEIAIILAELFRIFWQGKNFNKPINYYLRAFPENNLAISRRGYNANLEVSRLIATHFNYPLITRNNKKKPEEINLLIFSIFQVPEKKLKKLLLTLPKAKKIYLVLLVEKEAKNNFTNYL